MAHIFDPFLLFYLCNFTERGWYLLGVRCVLSRSLLLSHSFSPRKAFSWSKICTSCRNKSQHGPWVYAINRCAVEENGRVNVATSIAHTPVDFTIHNHIIPTLSFSCSKKVKTRGGDIELLLLCSSCLERHFTYHVVGIIMTAVMPCGGRPKKPSQRLACKGYCTDGGDTIINSLLSVVLVWSLYWL